MICIELRKLINTHILVLFFISNVVTWPNLNWARISHLKSIKNFCDDTHPPKMVSRCFCTETSVPVKFKTQTQPKDIRSTDPQMSRWLCAFMVQQTRLFKSHYDVCSPVHPFVSCGPPPVWLHQGTSLAQFRRLDCDVHLRTDPLPHAKNESKCLLIQLSQWAFRKGLQYWRYIRHWNSKNRESLNCFEALTKNKEANRFMNKRTCTWISLFAPTGLLIPIRKACHLRWSCWHQLLELHLLCEALKCTTSLMNHRGLYLSPCNSTTAPLPL